MLPCAPARFSTITCCVHSSPSFTARMRPSASVPPPGGNGTIRRTGLSGYCAWALPKRNAHSSPASNLFISVLVGRIDAIGEAPHGRPFEHAHRAAHLGSVHAAGLFGDLLRGKQDLIVTVLRHELGAARAL